MGQRARNDAIDVLRKQTKRDLGGQQRQQNDHAPAAQGLWPTIGSAGCEDALSEERRGV
jgi:hypothetical protein